MKDEFEWNDELVFEFVNFYEEYCNTHTLTWTSVAAEAFKKSKEPKKEYEILSFTSTYGVATFLRNPDATFGVNGVQEQTLLDSVVHKIHSVKRLSDGEVFTIGDKLNRDDTIDAFWLNYAGNPIWVSTDVRENNGCSLDRAVKAPKPIFKTEDGKEVFEGDTVWILHTNQWLICHAPAPNNPFTDERKIKYFSTQEATKEYILMNKPLLSVKDITDIFSARQTIQMGTDAFNYVIVSQAKSKLSN